ncbi:MAG: hypothetical protein PHC28_13940 [Flavobacterium sp.]|uniref:hypothetical protein n=1 Tax=Flavobacterium sp. TaxID=239 RepID=UPI0026140C1A|nr:hypothetical protein [Flavobacterium sp.]MDD5151554.1 hypothetical protein [Flavobacterium sp.]
MKKILLIAGIALLSLTVNAQEKSKGLQGAWFATSQIGYQQTKSGNHKSTNLSVLPIVGTFISPSVAVGAGIGYINIKSENGTTTAANTGLVVVEPLVRKYWNVSGSLYFFGQLAAPIINGKVKDTDIKVSQYGLAASGGFDYFVTKNFSVEFSYNLANLSFTKLKNFGGAGVDVETTDFSLAHVASVDSEYNSALGGGMNNAVTPLSFGFKFVF